MSYSFYVNDLIRKHKKYLLKLLKQSGKLTDNESEFSYEDLYLSDTNIKMLIIKELKTWEKTPVRKYLLQCANWDYEYPNRKKWSAYSPIRKRSGDYWALYDINLKYTKGSTNIEFNSWKGDYESKKFGGVYGSLPYKGKKKNFEGKIWTRGF
jgi:hypothetical protein